MKQNFWKNSHFKFTIKYTINTIRNLDIFPNLQCHRKRHRWFLWSARPNYNRRKTNLQKTNCNGRLLCHNWEKINWSRKYNGQGLLRKESKREEKLIYYFCLQHNLKVSSSYFKKNTSQKWTWKSPKDRKSEINFILSNIQDNINNLEILNTLNFHSDHRMVRA